MEIFRSWLLSIVATAMALAIVRSLLPKGAIRSIARVTGGLILLLVMLRPLIGTDWEHLADRYAAQEGEVNIQLEALNEDREKEMAHIIQEKIAAYISDKAAGLGLKCQAQVETELREGIPYPVAVRLDIPKNEALAETIASELGIPQEEQQWLGE